MWGTCLWDAGMDFLDVQGEAVLLRAMGVSCLIEAMCLSFSSEVGSAYLSARVWSSC